jgi:ribonuclease HI
LVIDNFLHTPSYQRKGWKQITINYLELLAILYALKALCKDKNSLHVQILTDNTSAVAHINNMGGIKSEDLNSLSKDIWNWCCDKNIWLPNLSWPQWKYYKAF